MAADERTVCANCGQAIAVGATTKQDVNGRTRHAEKCGPDLIGTKVRRQPRQQFATIQQAADYMAEHDLLGTIYVEPERYPDPAKHSPCEVKVDE